MTLRKGFKAEAASLAKEVRKELGLKPLDRLDPFALAQHLEIPVLALSELEATVGGAHFFLFEDPDSFSAVTVFDGLRRIIAHNDAHSKARQNSDLSHELSHGLLLHEPTPALDMTTGCRVLDSVIEEEADWLAGELLVTKEMALAVARGKFTKREAQLQLGVSPQMLRWRMNMTGANKIVQRARAS